MSLLEDFFDSALVICRCSSEGKKELVNLFLPELGHLVTEANICYSLRHETLRTLNSILNSVSREQRKKFPLSEEMCSLTKDLAKTILEVGDYDLQVALSEALCRLMTKKWRDDLVHHWFEDNYLAEAFKEIQDREFETDCRKFLNKLNERLGDESRVYSFPCMSAFADVNEVKKPPDEKLEEFWIDFNAGSQSVTFYVDSNGGALWDTVRLSKEAVSGYSLKEDGGQKIVTIYMKVPATFNKTEARKIKITFSADFDISSILGKVLGDEKMMIDMAEEESVHPGESVHAGEQAMQNETAIPESSKPQMTEDPSNFGNVETLSDNLTSQHSQQLTGTVAKVVNSGVTVNTVNQQPYVEDANQGSAKKSKTSSSRTKAKPRRGSRRQKVTRKEIYDFEISDAASHEKVAEAQAKILSQKVASQNQRSLKTGDKSKEPDKLKRRLSSYRKHLFSESSDENRSTGESEKSWILDSQKELLPKSLDYTRKRSRVRSKLKVLPVSSGSSGGDYPTKKQGASREDAQEEMPRKTSTSSSKGGDMPTVDNADEMPSEGLEKGPLLLNTSTRSYPSDVEKAMQEFHNASGKLSREEDSFKRKDSGILSSTVIKKPKFSRWEASDLSPDASYKARDAFDSVENKAEIQTGQEKDDNVDDVFFEMPEDISDPGVITAFESFISQLKKLLWSRYKRMETSAQNALRISEKNLSTLLNQIHECRLSKLETFQKIVVSELASLEKETQILVDMEKDAVDFWNTQLLKLNSFCNQQKQRIQSIDSALGETANSFADAIQNTTVRVVHKQCRGGGGL
ncbi:synaptonemal complex protein 2-like [Falco peregrinus]|uniref:synaptonemal complex protein 2-like n=1 Tax=Falco peregrinus TaxID=8954 RepID=UPI00247925AF|nr:synaptonemal complex protein 2-like [Falco peregrinus]